MGVALEVLRREGGSRHGLAARPAREHGGVARSWQRAVAEAVTVFESGCRRASIHAVPASIPGPKSAAIRRACRVVHRSRIQLPNYCGPSPMNGDLEHGDVRFGTLEELALWWNPSAWQLSLDLNYGTTLGNSCNERRPLL